MAFVFAPERRAQLAREHRESYRVAEPFLAVGRRAAPDRARRQARHRVHADFHRHPRLDLDRRLNVLLFLNPDRDERPLAARSLSPPRLA